VQAPVTVLHWWISSMMSRPPFNSVKRLRGPRLNSEIRFERLVPHNGYRPTLVLWRAIRQQALACWR
jgi:hypothetical protein